VGRQTDRAEGAAQKTRLARLPTRLARSHSSDRLRQHMPAARGGLVDADAVRASPTDWPAVTKIGLMTTLTVVNQNSDVAHSRRGLE